MSANIRLPHITEGPDREQLAQVKSYLHQLVNELNYQLDIIGSQGGSNLYENTRTDANDPSASNTNFASRVYVDSAISVAKSQADQNLKAHTDNKSNPHGVTAAQVGARPDTWMPTAAQVGARPNTWMPSASDVGAMAARPVQIEMAGSGSHGGYIDFHFGQSTADNTSRIIESASGTLSINGMTFASSDKTFKARNVYLTGTMGAGGKTSETDAKNGVIFGTSGNITMQGAETPTLNFINASATSPQASIALAGTNNQLHIKSKGNMLFYPISTNNTYFALLSNSMYHSTDNAVSCGASTKRWSTVYAGTGTINTSDRNEKENIRDIDEKYIRLFEKLRPVTYEFIGGNHDRIHIGYISQEVKEAMDEVGLTDLEFAGYCRDKKTEDVLDESGALVGQKDVLDENGKPVYQYALRYAEFIALNTKMIQLQQKTIQEQQEKIEAMEKEMRELKETVLSALRKHNIDI